MNEKRIIYTVHAIRRKLERDVSDEDILKTIKEPDYTMTSVEGRKI